MSTLTAELGYAELVQKYPDVSKFVILKLDLQRRGVVFSDAAVDAVPDQRFYFTASGAIDEKVSRRAKGVDPGPLILRDGTSAIETVGVDFEDPYLVDLVDGKFFVFDRGERIDEVDFTPRPAYFGKRTSRGVPMESIGVPRPQRLDIHPYRYCHFWDAHKQCKYCGFFTDLKEQRLLDSGRAQRALNPEDVYETVREALKEPGRFSQINLTGGADYSGAEPFDNEVDRYIEILQAIGRNFKSRRFPSQLLGAAYSKKQLQRLYDETGLTSYCPDIEVWDPALFSWICPGKDSWMGRDYWVRSALDAVDIFGWGNVYTNIVAGVEMAQPHGFKTVDEALASNFEACEFFAKRGVQVMSIVWRRYKNAIFRDQRQPPLEYYVRLVKGLHEIRKSYGLTPANDDFKHCGNHGDSDLSRLD